MGRDNMIKRRHFLGAGSAASLWLLGCLASAPLLADAPVENWTIEPAQVSDAARKALGAIELIFEIPEDWRKFYDRDVPPTELRLYTREHDEFHETRVIRTADVRPISEIVYEARRTARVPLLDETDEYVEVMYDVKSGARGWLYKRDLTITEGQTQREPEIDRLDGRLQVFSFPRTFRLFEWAPDHVLRVFAGPSSLEKFVDVKETLPNIAVGGRKIDYEQLTLAGTANGFAELVQDRREFGIDHVGWVRLRDDAGRLLVWPGTGAE